MRHKLPNDTLTFVIRNDAPMIHAGDCPTYRSVQIKLTSEQRLALSLQHTDTGSGGIKNYEVISRCFIEPEKLP